MAMETRYRAVLLPGGVLPAEPAYTALLQALGERVTAVAKDLEVYAGDRPPADYSLDTEVAGILREADDARFRSVPSRGLLGRRCLFARLRRSARRAAPQPGAPRTGMGRQRPDGGGGRPSGSDSGRSSSYRPMSSWPHSSDCSSLPASSHRRRRRARRHRGWRSGPRAYGPSSTRSTAATSTSTRYGRSTGRCTSRSAVEATPTTTAGWPTGWRRSSPTSRSRRSPSVTTSTRLTASNPSTSPTRCLLSGARGLVAARFGALTSGAGIRWRTDRPSQGGASVDGSNSRAERSEHEQVPGHVSRLWDAG